MNTALDSGARRCRAFDGTTGGRLGVGAGRYAVRRNNGDPACWRPARGAGFDCAALFGCRVRPFTRCAASLRMTQWVGWNVVRNFFGTKYSTVKLTDTAFCFLSHRPPLPPCHPERSGTTRQKSIAPTNHCRTAEPRPKRGASRRDLHYSEMTRGGRHAVRSCFYVL